MYRTEWDEWTREDLEQKEQVLARERDAVSRKRFGGGQDGEASRLRREEERRLDTVLHEVRQALKRKRRAAGEGVAEEEEGR